MREIMFSILVVSLNAGEKLLQTVQSILKQTCRDYEIVIKDGGSKDNSLTMLEEYLSTRTEAERSRIRVIQEPDGSIYDGMNQATVHAVGEYYYFLNCGDFFAEDTALEQTARAIRADKEQGGQALIYYGNIYDADIGV